MCKVLKVFTVFFVKEINHYVFILLDEYGKVYTLNLSSYDIQTQELERFFNKYIDISKKGNIIHIAIIINKFDKIIYHYYKK